MTNRCSRLKGTADIVPGSALLHRKEWRIVRSETPGAYIIGLPADNPKLRLRLLAAADRLIAKGLPVKVVELCSSKCYTRPIPR